MEFLKLTLPITLIAALRFFGLFVVVPVISVYALSLGATPLMLGLTVGGYALTQIIFQTPFGILGDRLDKRIIIAVGLIVFIAGSLLCAYADSIELLVLGRMIQGCGAISSVLSALLADLTPVESRTKAMAIMGGGISIAFLLSVLIGPFIGGYYGIKTLFFLATFASFLGLLILLFQTPKSQKISYLYHHNNHYSHLKDSNLWMMHLSSFLQKMIVSLAFVIIPLVLHKDFNFAIHDLWKLYAPAGIFGIFAMAPASIIAEKYGQYKNVMIAGILAFISCFALFFISDYYHLLWMFVLGIFIFFIGFDIHEPIIQSLASKYPKASQRSSALGLFTTFGFLGSFVGAILGGVLYNWIGLLYLSLLIGTLSLVWIVVLILILRNPPKQKTLFMATHLAQDHKLTQIDGITDFYRIQNTLVIQYNPDLIQEQKLKDAMQ